MTNEPLKDKAWRIGDGEPDIKEQEENEEVFYMHSVKSAVEWLREKNCYCQDAGKEGEKCDVCKDIDEAFEDCRR